MTVDRALNLLVTLALVELMVTIGLGVTVSQLLSVGRNWRLVLRAALANYVLVPAATVVLLLLFDAQPMVAAGFLILGVCPGAPYGPPFTSLSRGDVLVSVGLMVILAGSSAVVAPVLLAALLPLVSGSEPLVVDGTRIVVSLLGTQLVPLCVGVAIRQWCPGLADRLQRPADVVSKALNLLAVGLILVVQFHLLAEIRLRGFVGMLALLLASWAAGWLLGGPGAGVRRAMTLTTSLRNVGVGLVIASSAFAGTPAVTATLAYGLVAVAGSLLLAMCWGRLASPVPLAEARSLPGTGSDQEATGRTSSSTGAPPPGR